MSTNHKIVELHVPCEACGSSDAKCIWDDGHGFCYSCETYFPPKGEVLSNYTFEFLPLRGIEKDTFKFYNVKTKIDAEGKPISIGFPHADGSIAVRYLDKKHFTWVPEGDKSKTGLFGRDKFSAGSHKYVTVTEGRLDALSLYQILKSPCVSVSSASSAARDCGVDFDWLNSFERVYLAFDGDEPGRDATARVAKLFDYNKMYHVKFDRRKDANDYLRHGEGAELRQIWWNARRYLPKQIRAGLSEFEKILKEPSKPGVPYPFPTLTKMTYGIRTGESVLITAQEGIGKTEIMHSIEHKLLKETDDAIGAIFLEEPEKRHLQALAGLEMERPVHLPDSGCTEAEILAALKKVVATDERLYLYSHFGSDDPGVLLDTIRFLVSARSCRYVLLDHITMAVSGLQGDDERRALDYFATRLEMMVKELDFGLIIVSHVNDLGQTRGSRYISKVADIRIDCSRDLTADNPILRNTTYFKIAKNRFSGQTGPAGSAIFNPLTFTMKEDLSYANDNSPLWDESRVA